MKATVKVCNRTATAKCVNATNTAKTCENHDKKVLKSLGQGLKAGGTLVPVFSREVVTYILMPFALLVHYIMANRDNRVKGNDYV